MLWGSASSSRSHKVIVGNISHHRSCIQRVPRVLPPSRPPHYSTTSPSTPTSILSITCRTHDNTSSNQTNPSLQRRQLPNKAGRDGLLINASNSVALVRPPPSPPFLPSTGPPPLSSCIAPRATILSECTT